MATISSPGLASGMDIKSIVSQLVALERAPLQPLATQAKTIQSRLSIYGTIKSMASALGDAAAKLSTAAGWNGVKATSSNAATVGVSAAAGATPTSLSMQVTRLATAQTAASGVLNTAAGMGAGTLSISIGGGTSIDVVIAPGEDSLSAVVAKINGAKAGVTATVVKDGTGERVVMRAADTGVSKSFTIAATGGNADGLQRLAFGGGAVGGMSQNQAALDATFSINGVDLTSASNTLKDTVPGLTFTLSQVSTNPVEISVSSDTEGMKKNIQGFVDAYNALNSMLSSATRYDETTKTAGTLQGDSTAIGLQNSLRGMMRSVTSSSPFSRLADIGIVALQGGNLEIKTEKLDAALADTGGISKLFSASGDSASQGFGLKVKAFTDGLTQAEGIVTTKNTLLQDAIKRNTSEQDRVVARAARAEVRYLAQYNAMDAAVGKLSGLNAFVNQQITMWNKNSG